MRLDEVDRLDVPGIYLTLRRNFHYDIQQDSDLGRYTYVKLSDITNESDFEAAAFSLLQNEFWHNEIQWNRLVAELWQYHCKTIGKEP